MTDKWWIQLLGSLCAARGEKQVTHFRTGKTGALLACLAFHRGQYFTREELASLFWPGMPEADSRASLRVALASLRRQLESEELPLVLRADRHQISLDPDTYQTDTAEFESRLKRAYHQQDLMEQIQQLGCALELYQGELLPTLYEDWVLAERRRFVELQQGALLQLARNYEQAGDFREAIGAVQRVLRTDSLLEEAHLHLMRLYVANGSPSLALRHYRRAEKLFTEELGQPPSEDLSALAKNLRKKSGGPKITLPAPAPVARALTVNVSRPLPPLNTRFFGRQNEIERLTRLIEAQDSQKAGPLHRLITLTGAGGCGKTRLALEAGTLCQNNGRKVWFIPLAHALDDHRLIDAIHDALQLPRASADMTIRPRDQISDALCRDSAVLILDNFEQLLANEATGAIDLLRWLLERAPRLQCVVTSRQRLEIAEELEFSLQPLPVPAGLSEPEELMAYPSVELLVDRIQTRQPGFLLDKRNAASVVALCEQLEGLPLAIELAAGWAQVLTPAQMLTRLQHRFRFLTSSRKDLPSRHRSLHAACDYSYRLLSPEQQRLFTYLSVFRRNWSLEAVEFVVDHVESAPDREQTLERMAELQARSLIFTVTSRETIRFRMLEALREYTAEKLTPAEFQAASKAHALYYQQLATEAGSRIRIGGSNRWQERMDLEYANIAGALDWCIRPEGDTDIGLRLAVACWDYWVIRGYLDEGGKWVEALLQKADYTDINTATMVMNYQGYNLLRKNQHEEGRLLFLQAIELAGEDNLQEAISAKAGLGQLMHRKGDLTEACRLLEEALEASRAMGRSGSVAYLLCEIGQIYEKRSLYEAADLYYTESLQLWKMLDDHVGLAACLEYMSYLAYELHQDRRAIEFAQECVRYRRNLANWPGMYNGLRVILNAQQRLSLYDDAEKTLQEMLMLAHRLRDRDILLTVYRRLGAILGMRGENKRAAKLLEETLDLCRELDDQNAEAEILNYLGYTYIRMGDCETATQRLQEGLELRRKQLEPLNIAYALNNLGEVAALKGDLNYARSLCRESNEIFRSLKDDLGTAYSLHNLGNIARLREDFVTARVLYTENIELMRTLDEVGSLAIALARLAYIQSALDEEEALSSLREALTLMREGSSREGVVIAIESASSLWQRRGEYDRAATLLGYARQLRKQLGLHIAQGEKPAQKRLQLLLHRELDQKRYQKSFDTGTRLTLEEALALACSYPD